MKKILFVVRGFYPEISASGNLLINLLINMTLRNEIHVLSFANESTEECIFNNITIYKQEYKNKNRYLSYIKKFFKISTYDEKRVRILKKKIEDLDRKNNYDAIIAVTHDEIISLLRSKIEKHKKNCFILEKTPSLLGKDIFKYWRQKKRMKTEQFILENSNYIFCLPIVYNYFYKKQKYDKIVEIEHPMVINNIEKVKISDENKVVEIVYAGGLDRNQRNPLKIIEAFKKISNTCKIKLTIISYGNMQNILKKKSEDKDYEFLNFLGTKDSKIANNSLKNADIILTLGNKEVDIFPSKIFDCISTGNPIIHISQNREDQYYEYLERYRMSLVLKKENILEEYYIDKIVEFINKNKNKKETINNIEKGYLECTPRYVAEKIETILLKNRHS